MTLNIRSACQYISYISLFVLSIFISPSVSRNQKERSSSSRELFHTFIAQMTTSSSFIRQYLHDKMQIGKLPQASSSEMQISLRVNILYRKESLIHGLPLRVYLQHLPRAVFLFSKLRCLQAPFIVRWIRTSFHR